LRQQQGWAMQEESFGVTGMASRRPLFAIKGGAVNVFNMCTNVLVRRLVVWRVLVCILVLEANIKQSLFKLLLDQTEREPEVFISSTTGKKESLHHCQGQVVIVLTCGRELVGIFAEMNGQSLKVLAWVLT
jgi:hypothetical protein